MYSSLCDQKKAALHQLIIRVLGSSSWCWLACPALQQRSKQGSRLREVWLQQQRLFCVEQGMVQLPCRPVRLRSAQVRLCQLGCRGGGGQQLLDCCRGLLQPAQLATAPASNAYRCSRACSSCLGDARVLRRRPLCLPMHHGGDATGPAAPCLARGPCAGHACRGLPTAAAVHPLELLIVDEPLGGVRQLRIGVL